MATRGGGTNKKVGYLKYWKGKVEKGGRSEGWNREVGMTTMFRVSMQKGSWGSGRHVMGAGTLFYRQELKRGKLLTANRGIWLWGQSKTNLTKGPSRLLGTVVYTQGEWSPIGLKGPIGSIRPI